MIDNTLNNLPILKDFKELEEGDRIYSRQYGVGTTCLLYNDDEIVIQFSDLRKRLSIQDGISKIPERYFQKQKNTKVEVVFEGRHISLTEFKKRNRAEKKHMKLKEKLLREEQKRCQK